MKYPTSCKYLKNLGISLGIDAHSWKVYNDLTGSIEFLTNNLEAFNFPKI